MDNKNFFRALFWALLVFLIFQMVSARIWPSTPPPQSNDGGKPSDVSSVTTGAPTAASSNGAGSVVHGEDVVLGSGGFSVSGAASEGEIVLGTTEGGVESPYRMELRLSNRGASISTARLSDHRKDSSSDERYLLLSPLPRKGGGDWRSLTVERITLDGEHRIDLGDLLWTAEKRENNSSESAVFTAEVRQGDAALLKLTRTFTLPAQSLDQLRHDVQVTLDIENVSGAPHNVILIERGPVGLLSQGTFMPDQKVYAAWRSEGVVDLETRNFKEVGKKKTYRLYSADQQAREPLEWYAGGNLFFTCTMCPVDADGKTLPGLVTQVRGIDLDEDAETENDVTTEMTTIGFDIAAGESTSFRQAVFLGPKDRDSFGSEKNQDYLDRDYMQQIKEGYGSCTFSFLTDLMISMLNWIHKVTGNFGVAIIFLVIVVRTLLHPITKKTQVNMVRMQKNMGALQPKMEEIKKRHAGDNSRIQQEMMKLYRDEGVNPMGQMLGCLPMFLQMPVWIALYSSLRNNVAMRGEPFMLWISDLTAPDCLIHFEKAVSIPLMDDMTCFHLLPILVGVMMFAQQKLMPRPKPDPSVKKTSQSEQAEQMQKIMPYMSFVMIFLFYKFPSGLNLYIMTSSLVGAIEQLYIRKHIKLKDLEPPKEDKPRKPRGGPSFLQKLQQRAEDAQRQAKHRSGRRDRK
ncbi:MAG: membrane protein insertase YidC [Planctomycetes bacterium]|nr:membrane protein insertase YidC [Planctomycetota bacterium]